MIKRPMLAEHPKSDEDIYFPVFATPKIDGIRGLVLENEQGIDLYSRAMKPIRNKHINDAILNSIHCTPGLDGEIMVYKNGKMLPLNLVNSAVNSAAGEPDFVYHVFDYVGGWISGPRWQMATYIERQAEISDIPEDGGRIRYIKPKLLLNLQELLDYEAVVLELGYEGVITRDPYAKYKQGRSTAREQWMLKIKRFKSAEAYIVGIEEGEENLNDKQTNELGLTYRTSHKDGKIPNGRVGRFNVRSVIDGESYSFGVGPGTLTHEQSADVWKNRANYIGKFLTYKYFQVQVNAPVLPIFMSFRRQADSNS